MNISSLLFLFIALINSYIVVLFLFSYTNESYSSNKLTNVFILFFFILANALQYSKGTVVSSISIKFSDTDYEIFQLLVFAIIVLYNGIYIHIRHKIYFKIKSARRYVPAVRNPNIKSTLLVGISVIALLGVLYYYDFNFIKLIFRGLASSLNNIGESSSNSGGIIGDLIFSKYVRAMPCVCYIIAALCNWGKKIKFILFLSMLIATFPLGLSRNAAAMYWLPFAITSIKVFSKPNYFTIMMFVGLLVIFPLLDNFRYFNGSISLDFSLDYLNTMHFDASQQMMITMKWNFITWGKQLLGAILFFVPRAIWQTKPIGSGAFLASQQPGAFTNVSMPYWGEGYINFGLFGVLLFTFILSYFTAFADKRYWDQKRGAIVNLNDGYYLIFLGALLFILRGDLMSSFAFTVATFAAYYTILKISSVIKFK